MSNQVPEVLRGFKVYLNGAKDMAGVADIELPKLPFKTESVKGAGIAGEYDAVVAGHLSAMSCNIKWRTTTEDVMVLSQPKQHIIDARGSIQVKDASSGELKSIAVRISLASTPKEVSPGKFDTASAMDTGIDFSVVRYSLWLNNTAMYEIDVLNYKCTIAGEDFLAQTREDLGMS